LFFEQVGPVQAFVRDRDGGKGGLLLAGQVAGVLDQRPPAALEAGGLLRPADGAQVADGCAGGGLGCGQGGLGCGQRLVGGGVDGRFPAAAVHIGSHTNDLVASGEPGRWTWRHGWRSHGRGDAGEGVNVVHAGGACP